MDLSEHIKEFRFLEKTHKIRVADYAENRLKVKVQGKG